MVGKKVVVVDGMVRYESGMSLSQAYAEKSAYYHPIAGSLKRILHIEDVSFNGLVMGG